MNEALIQLVANAGYDVYMRKPKDTWLIFTDGKRLGYLQDGPTGGYQLATMHKPNRHHGTGYTVGKDLTVADLTKEKLAEAFMLAPDWAGFKSEIQKWRDFAEFREANEFNKEYKLVGTGRVP